MSCLNTPALSIPDFPLPSPISLTPPSTSPVSFDAKLCCKLPPVTIPVPPVSIGPAVLNPTVLATLHGYIDHAVAWVQSKPLSCPLER